MAWVRMLHEGQTDKAGRPYIQHAMRVYRHLRETFPEAGEDVQHAALLHDTIEDCGISAADLRARGYSETTVRIVEAVTRTPQDGLTYAQKIEQLAASGPLGAVQVKICDLLDNSDASRLAELPAEKAASLSKRYRRALEVLRASVKHHF